MKPKPKPRTSRSLKGSRGVWRLRHPNGGSPKTATLVNTYTSLGRHYLVFRLRRPRKP